MNIEQILDIAAQKGGGTRSDFRLPDIKKAFPQGALYKRAATIVLLKLGFGAEEIMEHIAYTPRSMKSAYRWWDEGPIAAAARELLTAVAAAEQKADNPPLKRPGPNPRAPRAMGEFGVYYQRRSASGGSSFHLMTREEAGR